MKVLIVQLGGIMIFRLIHHLRYLTAGLAISLLAALCHSTSTEDELFFLADHFPPYEFASPSGSPHGFDSEIIMAAFKRLNMPIRIEFQPWKRVLANVKNGKASGMFSCAYSEKRTDFVYLSDPISFATQGVIINKNYKGPSLSTLSDLKQVRVASISGYAANNYLEDAQIEYSSLSHISHAFPMLHYGRFDALFLSLEAGQFLAAEAGLSARLDFIPLVDIERRNYYLCFSKMKPGYQDLADLFNQALAELKALGEYQTIHRRYQ